MSIKDNYANGECPDCGNPIPVDAENGDSCPNCEHVIPAFACPQCQESDMDKLVWDKEGHWVTCQSCGRMYDPNNPKGLETFSDDDCSPAGPFQV